jgi:hypothetical protein
LISLRLFSTQYAATGPRRSSTAAGWISAYRPPASERVE